MTQVGWVKYAAGVGESGWSFLEVLAETEGRRGRRPGGGKWKDFPSLAKYSLVAGKLRTKKSLMLARAYR